MHLAKWLLILGVVESAVILFSFYVGLSVSWVDFAWGGQEIIAALPGAVFYTVILQAAVFALGAYSRVNIRKYVETSIRIFVAFICALGVLTLIFYSFPQWAIWRSVIILAMLAAFMMVLLVRFFAVRVINLDLLKQRVAVIGVGDQAARIENLLQSSQMVGFTCVGYIDFGAEVAKVPASKIIPRVNSLADFVIQENVDEVVVALQDRRQGLPSQALVECRLRGVDVVDYMTFFACETGRVDLDMIQPSWFAFSGGFRGNSSYRGFKRVLDLGASLALLCLSLPIMILAAIATRLDGPGPIILRQTRVGLNGNPFVLLKFRTMIADAEADGVPRWADQNDSRITRVGSLLRRTRIDELPQLFNILKGEMSFVGPRPERPHFVEQLNRQIPYFEYRHALKPGLAGWAQLYHHYAASVSDTKRKLEYDLYYVTHCGLLLDLLIILQTVRVVFWPNGVR